MPQLLSRIRRASCLLFAGGSLCAIIGCGNKPAEPAASVEPSSVKQPADSGNSTSPAPAPTLAAEPPQGVVEPPAAAVKSHDRGDELAAAREHLSAGRLDQARAIATVVAVRRAELPADQQAELAALEGELNQQRSTGQARQIELDLQQAQQLLAAGELADAELVIERLLASEPNASQRSVAEQVKQQIASGRQQQEQLAGLLPQLASDDAAAVEAAQQQLYVQAEMAIPLLRDALGGEDMQLASAAIQTLGQLQRPAQTTPILVATLADPARQELWPAVTAQLASDASAAAGAPLLNLAVTGKAPPARAAALAALAVVADPPRETLIRLLPAIEQGDETLPATLTAAAHAVLTHQQTDIAVGQGLDVEFSEAQLASLEQLPARLQPLLDDPKHPAHEAAQRLAMAMAQVPAEPLSGVSVVAFGAELPDGPAASVTDGVWQTVDLKKMWRQPADSPWSLVLDLGEERTVVGVRVWNYNEAGHTNRGWKDVALYVGSDPTMLTLPIVHGTLPPGSGVADEQDYGTTLPVSFVRGRYVRLHASSLWQSDGTTGLTEVQVLGY